MSHKRILIFSLAYHPMIGGAETAIKEITDRIGGIEFDMVTLRFHPKDARRERIGNVNVYRIGGQFGYLSKIFFIPQASFFALIRKYDMYLSVMTYMLFPVVILHILGKKVPYALNLQDGDPFTHVFSRLRILIFKPLLSYGFSHASRVQAISHFLAQWAKEMGYRGHVEVIPNGVDYRRFSAKASKHNRHKIWSRYGINYTDTILITTSRLVYKNAVDVIIRAIKLFPEHVCLVIFGKGQELPALKALAKKMDVSNRIHFCGEVSNSKIVNFLQASDIFIRPSRSEGMGISFVEAMAAGLPVIATPVGGIVDFLKDGETGLFCEVNNPESIARGVTKLLADYDLRKKLIENSRRLVREKYEWDLIAREMKSRVFDI